MGEDEEQKEEVYDKTTWDHGNEWAENEKKKIRRMFRNVVREAEKRNRNEYRQK